jgi:hypothetical protein
VNRLALTTTIIASTLLLAGGTSLIPNVGRPSNSLAVEIVVPVVLAAIFSLIAGYAASRRTSGWWEGALAGAVNCLVNLGFLSLLLSVRDRHFRSIGGPGLAAVLPLAAVLGGVFGAAGAYLKKLARPGQGSAALSI